jgi:pimeloyl-ACP methyl ester carboxylesterase
MTDRSASSKESATEGRITQASPAVTNQAEAVSPPAHEQLERGPLSGYGRVQEGPPPIPVVAPRPFPQFLEVEHGQIAYDMAGEGLPIVLLHQAIADRRVWDREIGTLSRTNRVVRYDLRGFGESSPSTEPFSHVRDLKALIQHLRLDRPLVVGPSAGGKIAIDYALAFPEAVGGLILIAPGFSGMDYPMFPEGKEALAEDDRRSQEIQRAWKEGRAEDAVEGLRELWGAALEGPALELFRTMVRDNAQEVFAEVTGQHERPFGPPAADRLSTITVPTWVVVGTRDNPASPHIARYVAKEVPGAMYLEVPQADHLLNLSRPDAFDGLVREALQRIRPSSPTGARA